MKKCQICGKRASMFLTQIVNGQVTELALCEECARKKGLFDPQSLAFSEKFFPDAFKKRVDEIVRELTEVGEQALTAGREDCDVLTRCPACSFTLEGYRKTGRLGCPECYAVFARELDVEPSDNAVDGDGSAPAEATDTPAALEKLLKEAVAREDYEQAAQLRDRLRQLNEKESS